MLIRPADAAPLHTTIVKYEYFVLAALVPEGLPAKRGDLLVDLLRDGDNKQAILRGC